MGVFGPGKPRHEHAFRVKSVALVRPDGEALRRLADPAVFSQAIGIYLDEDDYTSIAEALLERSVPRTSVLRECSCGALKEEIYSGDHTQAFR